MTTLRPLLLAAALSLLLGACYGPGYHMGGGYHHGWNDHPHRYDERGPWRDEAPCGREPDGTPRPCDTR